MPAYWTRLLYSARRTLHTTSVPTVGAPCGVVVVVWRTKMLIGTLYFDNTRPPKHQIPSSGTVTDVLAHTLFSRFILNASFHVDLRGIHGLGFLVSYVHARGWCARPVIACVPCSRAHGSWRGWGVAALMSMCRHACDASVTMVTLRRRPRREPPDPHHLPAGRWRARDGRQAAGHGHGLRSPVRHAATELFTKHMVHRQ